MKLRDLGEKRLIRRPTIDRDELNCTGKRLEGEFDLRGELISRADQNGVIGEGMLSECVLEEVNLNQARLSGVMLTDVVMRRTVLNNGQWLQASARRVELEECQAIGWNFGCDLVSDLYASDCRFDYGRITLERTKGYVCFDNCSFRETTIRGNVTKVIFVGCDFEGAEFQVADAHGCDLSGSPLHGARGLLSLRGARITTSQTIDIADRVARESGFVISD